MRFPEILEFRIYFQSDMWDILPSIRSASVDFAYKVEIHWLMFQVDLTCLDRSLVGEAVKKFHETLDSKKNDKETPVN